MSYSTSASSNYYPIYHPSLFTNPETKALALQSNAHAYSQLQKESSNTYSAMYSHHVGTSGGTMTHSYFGTHSSSCIG
jgi:hypothetical protein